MEIEVTKNGPTHPVELRKNIVAAINDADVIVTMRMDADGVPNIGAFTMRDREKLFENLKVLQAFFAQADIDTLSEDLTAES